MTRPGRSPLRRLFSEPRRFFAGAALLALLLALAQWGWSHRRSRVLGPAAGACWIWSPEMPELASNNEIAPPVALYAFRDVELATVPAAGVKALVTADESYLLYINGAWVGAGQYRAGAGLDAFDVTPWLVAGRNRVVIEARTSRGVGGVLAALVDVESGAPLLVSDGGWRIAQAHDPAILRLETSAADLAEESVPATIWGVPPAGRWQVARKAEPRPVWFRAGRPPEVVKPALAMQPGHGARWRRLRPKRIELPDTLTGPRTIFDFGRVIEAVPVIDLAGIEGLEATGGRLALVGLAEEVEAVRALPLERDYLLLNPVLGAPFWAPSTPIRFRYLEVFGTRLVNRPFALLAPGVAAVAPDEASRAVDGVFGIAPLFAPPRAIRAVVQRVDEEARGLR